MNDQNRNFLLVKSDKTIEAAKECKCHKKSYPEVAFLNEIF